MQQKGNNLCVPNNNNNIDKTKKTKQRGRPSIVWLLRESKLSPMSNKR